MLPESFTKRFRREPKVRERWTREDVYRQIGIQIFLLIVLVVVAFPVVWILSMALDPRGLSKPEGLTLIPPGASLDSFRKVLFEPFQLLCTGQTDDTCMHFAGLLKNSLLVALGTAVFAVGFGASAAYAFSRFKFIGRQAGMMGFIVLLMMPSTGLLAPLFVLLSQIRIADEPLRSTLMGLAIAYAAGALPFAVWNLKGYFDTIPRDLEEAALVDGASTIKIFYRIILPLSAPAMAVTTLFSFMTGWTEFILAWVFLDNPQRFTLAMALRSMQGQFTTPWPEFAAMSILMSVPILFLFFALQRWIVSGLTVGSVKG